MNTLFSTQRAERSAVVTGATGFVGGHLVRRLINEGWRVDVVKRVGSRIPQSPEFSKVSWHEHDGSTEGLVSCLAEAKADIVFHLASFAIAEHAARDVEPLVTSNVLFGAQLLEAMRANSITRLVNTGSFWQHFQNQAFNPSCLYAATKQAFESLLEYYIQACDFRSVTLTLFDTYGPEDFRPKLLNLISGAVDTGEALDLTLGEQLIDLVYIDDVTDAYIIASQRLFDSEVRLSETFAVSSGSPLTLRQLVELCERVTETNIKVNWGAKPYRSREVMVPWNSGLRLPNWGPKTNIYEGLRHILRSRK